MKLPSLICSTSVFYTTHLLKNVVYGESCQKYNSKLLWFILSMHLFKFQEKKKKKKNAIHQPGSVCIGKNCALSLEYCPWLYYPRPGAQFFPIQTSHLANNIYLLYKLLCCARMSNPKNSHNSTLVKLLYFFYMFNITNQLLTHQSFFMPICKVDKWTWLRIHHISTL